MTKVLSIVYCKASGMHEGYFYVLQLLCTMLKTPRIMISCRPSVLLPSKVILILHITFWLNQCMLIPSI